ncbi:MAG: NIPSNAP family protein [Bryobacterales bacterium]|nr:NIPSNAP family protein [Bryobacterales bacterium]
MAASTAGAAVPLPAASTRQAVFELRRVRMRNGSQVQRTTEFFSKYYAPALERLELGPAGFFSAVIAEQSPFLLSLVSYPSLAAMEIAMEKMDSDAAFRKGFDEYNSMSEPGYIRMESSLLRAFRTMPGIEVPPPSRAPRVFELRVYESMNQKAGKRKVAMFDDDGEIDIFRRCGMLPVFFGETIAGADMPNLTYMLAFDDLAAREKAWRAFGSHPDWQKLRARPELSDALLVSNISNAILRPLPFSSIR